MSVYTTIFAGARRSAVPVMGGIASIFGVAISLAVGGLLPLGIGGGALAWTRRNRQDLVPRRNAMGDPRRTDPGDLGDDRVGDVGGPLHRARPPC